MKWFLLAVLLLPVVAAHGAEHSGPGAYEEEPDSPFVAGRFVLYAGMAAVFGAAAMLMLQPPSGHRGLFLAMAAGALLQVLALVQLAGLEARFLGASVSQYASSLEGLLSSLRILLTVLLAGVGMAGAMRMLPWRFAVLIGLVLGVFLAWMQASLSHADGRSTTAIVWDWVHLVSATTWLGGLITFIAITWRDSRTPLGPGSLALARRFSVFALAAAAVFVASGVANAVLSLGAANLRQPALLWEYPYGRSLILKTTGVVVVLGLAALNRLWLHGAPPWLGRLRWLHRRPAFGRRYVVGEAVAGVLVLVLASLLVSSAPLPRVFDPLDYETFSVDISGQQHEGVAWLVPYPQVGEETLLVYDLHKTSTGAVVHWSSISFTVRNLDSGYNQSYAAEYRGGPLAGARDVLFPEPGRYLVEAVIQPGSRPLDTLSFGIVLT